MYLNWKEKETSAIQLIFYPSWTLSPFSWIFLILRSSIHFFWMMGICVAIKTRHSNSGVFDAMQICRPTAYRSVHIYSHIKVHISDTLRSIAIRCDMNWRVHVCRCVCLLFSSSKYVETETHYSSSETPYMSTARLDYIAHSNHKHSLMCPIYMTAYNTYLCSALVYSQTCGVRQLDGRPSCAMYVCYLLTVRVDIEWIKLHYDKIRWQKHVSMSNFYVLHITMSVCAQNGKLYYTLNAYLYYVGIISVWNEDDDDGGGETYDSLFLVKINTVSPILLVLS